MFRRRQGSHGPTIASLLVLTAGLSWSAPSAWGQSCKPDLSAHVIGSKNPGPDGKIHITYKFDAAPIAAISQAATNAVNQWNGYSSVTNVVFEPAGAGQAADLIFRRSTNPSNTQGCSAYDSSTERIYFGPELELRATQNSVAAAATVFAHEMGHFLGLADAGPYPPPFQSGTIMNNPTDPINSANCRTFSVLTTTVQSNDASKAVQCIAQAHTQQTAGGGGNPGGLVAVPIQQTSCTAWYSVIDHYYCNKTSCIYTGSTWTYVSTTCS